MKQSDVQLLVDYIIFKLKKAVVKGGDPADGTARWDDVGYDIESFTVPEPSLGSIKSNHFKQKADPAQKSGDTDKENQSNNVANKDKIDSKMNEKEAVDESKMTEEEKAEYHKKKEEEMIQ